MGADHELLTLDFCPTLQFNTVGNEPVYKYHIALASEC